MNSIDFFLVLQIKVYKNEELFLLSRIAGECTHTL